MDAVSVKRKFFILKQINLKAFTYLVYSIKKHGAKFQFACRKKSCFIGFVFDKDFGFFPIRSVSLMYFKSRAVMIILQKIKQTPL